MSSFFKNLFSFNYSKAYKEYVWFHTTLLLISGPQLCPLSCHEHEGKQ